MTRRPEDFDTMANPSTLWLANESAGFGWTSAVRLTFFSGELHLHVEVGGDGAIHDDAAILTAEAVAELRDQLDAWLKWAGHDRRCEHTIGRYRPYCAEMVCHNYAGRHAHEVDE